MSYTSTKRSTSPVIYILKLLQAHLISVLRLPQFLQLPACNVLRAFCSPFTTQKCAYSHIDDTTPHASDSYAAYIVHNTYKLVMYQCLFNTYGYICMHAFLYRFLVPDMTTSRCVSPHPTPRS